MNTFINFIILSGVFLTGITLANVPTLTTTEMRLLVKKKDKFTANLSSIFHTNKNGESTSPETIRSQFSIQVLSNRTIKVQTNSPEDLHVTVPADVKISKGKVHSIKIPRSSVKKIFTLRMLVSSFELLKQNDLLKEIHNIELDAAPLDCIANKAGLKCSQHFYLNI